MPPVTRISQQAPTIRFRQRTPLPSCAKRCRKALLKILQIADEMNF
jgi:hypothetical protein